MTGRSTHAAFDSEQSYESDIEYIYIYSLCVYFSSDHPTYILNNHFTFNIHFAFYNLYKHQSQKFLRLQHFKMKWSFIVAFAAFALGAAAIPAENAAAAPEALYISPIKYAEFEEDAAKKA